MPLALVAGDSRGMNASGAAPGIQGGESTPFDANRLKSILSRQPAPAELEIEHSAKSEKLDELAALTDFQINEKIARYTSLKDSLEMKDSNVKLHRQLQLLQAEKDRREKIRAKDGKHVQSAGGNEARSSSRSSSPPQINEESFSSSTKLSVFPEAVERVQQSDRTASGQQAGPSCPPSRRTNWSCLNSLSRSATAPHCTRLLAGSVVIGHQSARRLRSAGLKENGTLEGGETSESDRKTSEPSSIGLSMDNAMELVSSDDEDPGRVPVGPNYVTNGRRPGRRAGLRPFPSSRLDGQTIAYPSRDDPDAIEVPFSDLQRLAPLEFLNDTIIDFYIKYMQKEWKGSKERDEFHFFNTFFYKKLSDIVIGQKPKRGENKESKDNKEKEILKLRKWTKGTNIFDKAYLFVPVHDKLHWSLAIICLPRRKWDGLEYDPCIIHLDSMQPGHNSQYIFRALRTYLIAEWKHRDDEHAVECDVSQIKKLKISAETFQAKRVPVPQQENESDCGLFLLHYIQRFIEDSPPDIRWSELEELKDKLFGRRWFDPQDASSLRSTIQTILQSLFEAQERAQENTAQQLDKGSAPSKSEEDQTVTVLLDLDIQRTEATQDDLQLLVDLDVSPEQKASDNCLGLSRPEVVEG